MGTVVGSSGWNGVKVTVGLTPGPLRIGARGATAPHARAMAHIKAKPTHLKNLALPSLHIRDDTPARLIPKHNGDQRQLSWFHLNNTLLHAILEE